MNDFADWLSPILVKELRQGMRTKVFIGVFIVIQVFMIIGVLISLASRSDRSGVDGLFWGILGISILFIMPLRGFGALNGEIKGNTLELMLLTQLSAWRITAGKWLALVLQTLLVVCAVLPYVVLRYFLGGVNITDDLAVVGWMLGGSALLTAVAVGTSPFVQTVLGRLMLGIGIFMGIQIIPEMLFASRITGGVSSSTTTAWAIAGLVLGPLFILQFFEIGVGKIAPGAENHAASRRIIAVAILGLAAILGRGLHQQGMMMTLAAFAVTPICLGTLIEETVEIPSLYLPFVRRKMLGTLAGKFLYPGWASGLLFILLVAGVFLAGAPIKWANTDPLCQTISIVEAIFAPLALVRLGFRKAKSVLPYYFGLQLLLFVMAIFISVNDWPSGSGMLSLVAPMPTIGFFVSLWKHETIDSSVPATMAVTFISVVGLLLLSLKEWKIIGAMEREAAKLD